MNFLLEAVAIEYSRNGRDKVHAESLIFHKKFLTFSERTRRDFIKGNLSRRCARTSNCFNFIRKYLLICDFFGREEGNYGSHFIGTIFSYDWSQNHLNGFPFQTASGEPRKKAEVQFLNDLRFP